MKPKPDYLKISPNDRIICAYCRPASGPGWSNSPLWIITKNRSTGLIQEHCLQPQDFPPELFTLYNIASEIDASLLKIIKPLTYTP